MNEHVLHCFTGTRRVGVVGYDPAEEAYSFAYADAWLADPQFPLSPHLPLRPEPHLGHTVRRFLENLLPEGRALDVAVRLNQISRGNVYALLRQLGHEPAGAFSFQMDAAPPAEQAPERIVLDNDELARRIRERDSIPFSVWQGRVRLSIAGAQDKLQVLVEGDRISLAEGSLSSTHILKPESSDGLPCMVANEHFCMTLAARMGLSVAPVELRRLPEPILLIQRFDRVSHGERIERRHIIDGCQALDLPLSHKYERNLGSARDVRNIREGVSFERLFSVQDQMVSRVTGLRRLLQWALLQFLIGNSDAHGKNASFFVSPGGLTPAPYYDLVAVQMYGNRFEQDMAMAFGDTFELKEVGAYQFADFAQTVRIPMKLLVKEMQLLARNALSHAPELAKSDVYVDGEREFVGNIATFVCEQANRLLHISRQVEDAARLL